MNAPGPAGERAPASAARTGQQPTVIDTVPRLRREAPMAAWPPEPFPGASDEPTIRPAPMRVLTTRVTTPPVHTLARTGGTPPTRIVATLRPGPVPLAERTPAADPARTGASWAPRGSRGRRTAVLMLLLLVLALAVGGLIGVLVTRHDADHGATQPSLTSVALTAAAPSTTAAPPTTVAATTTAAAAPTGSNVLGIANGTPANAASALAQERYAAHLGRDETAATPGTPAQLYAMWWELFGGPPPVAVASPNGFSFADGNGQTIELTGFVLGPDGQVSDLVECAYPPTGAPTCNQLANVLSIDATAPVVGQSPNVTFTRAAELRLLRNSVVRFVGLTAAQPITSITSPTAAVRFNDHVAGIVVPAGSGPVAVDLTITYADGTTETVTVTV